MAQEDSYLTALRRARTVTTTLTSLELFDDDANQVADFRFGGRVR
jgi:hypothetical protein